MVTNPVPIFDGHNDVLLRLFRNEDFTVNGFFRQGMDGHIDLPRAQAGHLAAGFFAVFVPSPANQGNGRSGGTSLSLADASQQALAMCSLLLRIEEYSGGKAKLCTTVAAIEACMEAGQLAMILHFEGAEAIDENLVALDGFYNLGLRSLGPVWSRSNIFGHGAPFQFPGSPDHGGGLTEAGKNLIRACNEKGIMIDLSHLNEKGFWDVAEISSAPLVATHSNAHAVTPAPRNLTDQQLDAIAASGGIAGLNYATCFLRDDGKMNAETPISALLAHLDHLLKHLGEGGVALGSDFDGAVIPAAIGDVSGNQRLVNAMRQHGYGEALIERICWRNWLDILRRTWPAN